MERKEFLSILGVGAGSIIISSCLGGCSKSDSSGPTPGPGGKVDFTVDVSTNADLNAKGWTILNSIIIAKSGSSYLALSGVCTHQQSPMTYNPSTNTFPCSQQDAAHGSIFNANGIKITGPATSSLKKYSTTLSGNSLRVFEA